MYFLKINAHKQFVVEPIFSELKLVFNDSVPSAPQLTSQQIELDDRLNNLDEEQKFQISDYLNEIQTSEGYRSKDYSSHNINASFALIIPEFANIETIKILQGILGCKQDGLLGPETIKRFSKKYLGKEVVLKVAQKNKIVKLTNEEISNLETNMSSILLSRDPETLNRSLYSPLEVKGFHCVYRDRIDSSIISVTASKEGKFFYIVPEGNLGFSLKMKLNDQEIENLGDFPTIQEVLSEMESKIDPSTQAKISDKPVI